MPLTPEDVRNKEFSTVKLREGYNVDEVDAFLDEVEAELSRLLRENADLRAKLGAAQAQGGVPKPAAAPVEEQPIVPPTPVAPVQPAGENVAEMATGILAMAQRTAEEHLSQARAEADRLVGEARARAEQLRREAEERHHQVMGTLEADRANLERRLEELRNFEREYRNRLKTYLQTQLRELEAGAGEIAGPGPQVDRAPFGTPVGGNFGGHEPGHENNTGAIPIEQHRDEHL